MGNRKNIIAQENGKNQGNNGQFLGIITFWVHFGLTQILINVFGESSEKKSKRLKSN